MIRDALACVPRAARALTNPERKPHRLAWPTGGLCVSVRTKNTSPRERRPCPACSPPSDIRGGRDFCRFCTIGRRRPRIRERDGQHVEAPGLRAASLEDRNTRRRASNGLFGTSRRHVAARLPFDRYVRSAPPATPSPIGSVTMRLCHRRCAEIRRCSHAECAVRRWNGTGRAALRKWFRRDVQQAWVDTLVIPST